MVKMNDKVFFTLDDINDVIETFEDFLRDYGVTIPESEEEKRMNNAVYDNDWLIYGMVYGDLQFRLLEYFEKLTDVTERSVIVVNSWSDEVEDWREEDE